MKVIIKDIFGNVIIEGKYNSFVEEVEKNKNNLVNANLENAKLVNANLENAYLYNANLYNANLGNANLYNAKLVNANLGNANLYNANLENAKLENANLENANLKYAKLVNAKLYNANLYNANLGDANLENAKGYVNSHDIFAEIVSRQGYKFWITEELKVINFIWLYRKCWKDIKKQFGKKAMSVFKKLSKLGYNEWELKYKEILTGGK